METRIVFHIDFDYFYAQCEEIRNPELKSKPVCVCVFSDRGGDSGAIATANYTAREFGVKSGIPIVFAKKRLKDQQDAVFLPVDFDFYRNMSEKGMEIMEKNADVFEYVGKDEAFLDVTQKVDGDWEKAKKLYLSQVGKKHQLAASWNAVTNFISFALIAFSNSPTISLFGPIFAPFHSEYFVSHMAKPS